MIIGKQIRLEDTGRGLNVVLNGRRLYSRYNPAERPARIARSAAVERRCLYLVPSPLLGYGLTELASRLPDDSLILAAESSAQTAELCEPHIRELTDGDSRIIRVCIPDNGTAHKILKNLGIHRFRRVQRVSLNGGAALPFYDQLFDFLVNLLASYWRNRYTMGRMGRHWIRHLYANMALIACGRITVSAYPEITRLPLVAGAGPSLEAALDFAARFRRHLWIAAVDTALPVFLKAGITPDITIILETQAVNMHDFHGSAGIPLAILGDLTAYPPSLTLTNGTVSFFSSDFAELDFLSRMDAQHLRPERIPPLGSVGLAALELILRKSAGPVLISGLDFAYRPGKSHARGTFFHRMQNAASGRLNPVPGWASAMERPLKTGFAADGAPQTTDRVLENYAALLKDRYSGSGRVFVLAPGGLDLGLPVLNLDNASCLFNQNAGRGVQPSGESAALNQKNAAAFIDSELDKLQNIADCWDDFAAGTSGSAPLIESLNAMDQVFADFQPDFQDHVFLARSARRAKDLIRYIHSVKKYAF